MAVFASRCDLQGWWLDVLRSRAIYIPELKKKTSQTQLKMFTMETPEDTLDRLNVGPS